MPIDPSIPLQAKGVQLESPINQLGMMNEALKYNEMNRSIDTQNKLRDLYSQGVDVNTPEGFKQLASIDPATAMKLRTQGLETKKLEGDIRKTGVDIDQKTFDLVKQKMADLAFNPSDNNIKAHLEDGILRKEVTPQQAQMTWQAVSALPLDKRKAYFTDLGMKAADRAQLETTRRGQDLSAATTRRGQDLANNPTLQGNIAEQRKIGEARAEEATAPARDVRANVKALKSAGYDPETGKDSISELIGKSTGSFVGAGTDLAGRAVGISTSGAKAIAALKTYESKLTQDLLGGKMGAGISNADRDFIVAGIGQIADSTLPVETRQAAWNAVKERMRVAGMVPAPKGEGAPADNPYAKKTDAEIKKELGL